MSGSRVWWSASYNPNPLPTNPCELVGDGSCIPDAPAPCGCPLYDPGSTVLPPDSGVDCAVVCNEYASCQRDGDLELGFTCDATLCTAHERDVLFDACLGLEKCDLSEIFKAEQAADCSCCASQLCGCEPNAATDNRIVELDAAQAPPGRATVRPQRHAVRHGTVTTTPPGRESFSELATGAAGHAHATQNACNY